MFKNKIATAGMAGMLAMTLGLAACANNAAPQEAEATKTETIATDTAATDATTTDVAKNDATMDAAKTTAKDDEDVVYWDGTLEDGREAIYMTDDDSDQAMLSIFEKDYSDGKVWTGACATAADGTGTITDVATKDTVTFTIKDLVQDSSMTLDIKDYGEVKLTAITEDAFEKELNALAKSLGKALSIPDDDDADTTDDTDDDDDSDDTTLYWEGELSDGRTVTYVDTVNEGQALLTIGNDDLSQGETWFGDASTKDDTVTITNDEDNKTISFTMLDVTSQAQGSMKINIEGYGEVELKAVTEASLSDAFDEFVDGLIDID